MIFSKVVEMAERNNFGIDYFPHKFINAKYKNFPNNKLGINFQTVYTHNKDLCKDQSQKNFPSKQKPRWNC